MAGFGAETSGRTALGAAHGFPYSVRLADVASGEMAFAFTVDGPARAAAAMLNKKKIPYTRWHTTPLAEGGRLEVIYKPPSDFYAKSGVFTLLSQAALALGEAGLAPPQSCPLCGLAGCDSYAVLEGGWRPAHAACLESRLTGAEEDVQPPTRVKGHIATGILGALLGAFIGALPIFTLALTNNTLSWALYVFIPFFSGLCYRLCRGRANATLAGLSVLLASLLAALALEQVWYWLYLTSPAQFGRNLPFSFTVAQYFRTHNLLSAIQEMWLCLLALLVGFVAITFFLRRYAGEDTRTPPVVRGTKYIRATARPMKQWAAPSLEDDEADGDEPPSPDR